MTDETIQVGVIGPLDFQVATANIVNGLVVDQEGAVRMLHCGVSAENGVVRLDDGGTKLCTRVDGEIQL